MSKVSPDRSNTGTWPHAPDPDQSRETIRMLRQHGYTHGLVAGLTFHGAVFNSGDPAAPTVASSTYLPTFPRPPPTPPTPVLVNHASSSSVEVPPVLLTRTSSPPIPSHAHADTPSDKAPGALPTAWQNQRSPPAQVPPLTASATTNPNALRYTPPAFKLNLQSFSNDSLSLDPAASHPAASHPPASIREPTTTKILTSPSGKLLLVSTAMKYDSCPGYAPAPAFSMPPTSLDSQPHSSAPHQPLRQLLPHTPLRRYTVHGALDTQTTTQLENDRASASNYSTPVRLSPFLSPSAASSPTPAPRAPSAGMGANPTPPCSFQAPPSQPYVPAATSPSSLHAIPPPPAPPHGSRVLLANQRSIRKAPILSMQPSAADPAKEHPGHQPPVLYQSLSLQGQQEYRRVQQQRALAAGMGLHEQGPMFGHADQAAQQQQQQQQQQQGVRRSLTHSLSMPSASASPAFMSPVWGSMHDPAASPGLPSPSSLNSISSMHPRFSPVAGYSNYDFSKLNSRISSVAGYSNYNDSNSNSRADSEAGHAFYEVMRLNPMVDSAAGPPSAGYSHLTPMPEAKLSTPDGTNSQPGSKAGNVAVASLGLNSNSSYGPGFGSRGVGAGLSGWAQLEGFEQEASSGGAEGWAAAHAGPQPVRQLQQQASSNSHRLLSLAPGLVPEPGEEGHAAEDYDDLSDREEEEVKAPSERLLLWLDEAAARLKSKGRTGA